jgi:glucose/arabinose dehydrogenase
VLYNFLFVSLSLLIILTWEIYDSPYVGGVKRRDVEPAHPYIVNVANSSTRYRVEPIVNLGFDFPTSMKIIAPNDILVLEKDEGTIWRIVNGKILDRPLLDLDVVSSDGLLGIALSKNEQVNRTNIYLYYTQAPTGHDGDIRETEEYNSVNRTFGYVRECNCLYKYELTNNSLSDPKLLLSLPSYPGGQHHGGKITIGPDDNIYVTVGEIEGHLSDKTKTKAQNYLEGTEPDGRSGILRVTQEGEVVGGKGILGDEHPLDMYYAYGIRNSFGLDFDPVTDRLWDTENGPDHGDEINLVEPGFNSGFHIVDGMSGTYAKPDGLVEFNGKGKYSDPEFVWNKTVGPTAIKFLNSDKYGKAYENDMLVGDINNGNIYHFDLNEERTELDLKGALQDKIANTPEEAESAIFGKGFGGITDIQVGPDGYIYVISHGSLFRILPID